MARDRFEKLILALMERLDLLSKKMDDVDKKFDCLKEEIVKQKIRITKIETWGAVLAFMITSGLLFKIFMR